MQNVAHHLRGAAASGECVMLCGDRRFFVPRCRNELHTIFDHHFPNFCEQYDEKYASKYGMFRLERIQQIGEKFSTLPAVAPPHDRRLFADVSRLSYSIITENLLSWRHSGFAFATQRLAD